MHERPTEFNLRVTPGDRIGFTDPRTRDYYLADVKAVGRNARAALVTYAAGAINPKPPTSGTSIVKLNKVEHLVVLPRVRREFSGEVRDEDPK